MHVIPELLRSHARTVVIPPGHRVRQVLHPVKENPIGSAHSYVHDDVELSMKAKRKRHLKLRATVMLQTLPYIKRHLILQVELGFQINIQVITKMKTATKGM